MARKPKWNIENNVVYTYTNVNNGKKYCGITCRGLKTRAGKGGKNYTASNPNSHFANAIRQYGWDAFKPEIIFENLSREEACEKEEFIIQKYNLLDERYGYNMTIGGDKIINSDASVHFGEKNGMYGKGYLLEGANNGRAVGTTLQMPDGTCKHFNTQKECREFLNIGKDLFRSLRDYDGPFEFSKMTNKSKIDKNKHIIGMTVTVKL